MRPMASPRGTILATIAVVAASIVGCGSAPPTEDWSTLPETVSVVPLLWLRADSLSGTAGSPIARWPAVAGPDAVQHDPANQPTLGELRGRPAVRFDGID